MALQEMRVLYLSQDFSMHTPGFAGYAGPSIEWIKRLAFDKVGGAGALVNAARRHAPRRADSLRLGRQVRGAGAAVARGAGLRRRPGEDGRRRLSAVRPGALRALGARHRHHDRAGRHPRRQHRLPPLLPGVLGGPQRGRRGPLAGRGLPEAGPADHAHPAVPARRHPHREPRWADRRGAGPAGAVRLLSVALPGRRGRLLPSRRLP